MRTWLRLQYATVLVAAVIVPAFAYDYPLSSTAVREAYFLGSGTNGASVEFLAQYTHGLPLLKVGRCTSAVRVETPYYQVAEHARQAANYSAQDAVVEFASKPPSEIRMQLDICAGQKESQPVKFRITQNEKELVPSSVERTPYFAAQRVGRSQVIGEHVKLRFEAEKIESAPLTVEIETPKSQHAETSFDLAKLR